MRRVRSVPGIEAAGVTDALPLDRDRAWGVRAEGQVLQPGQSQTAHVRIVGPQYFEAIGISLLAGRDIGPQDAPPAVLASSLRNVLRSLDPTLPVADFRPLTQFVDRAVSPRRFFVSLLSAFAVIALLLASVACLAGLIPARRASRVDPITALRVS